MVGEDDAAACSWAAGFVQASDTVAAAWARHGHKVNASSGTFGRLRGLAARAALWRVHSRVTDDEGKPILQALSEQPAAGSELEAVLQDLWSTVKKVRSAGMQTV